MFGQFMKMNIAFTLGLGSLLSNIVANLRGDLKAITTRSGISYDGPPIPPPSSSLPKVVEREPELVECLALADIGVRINLIPFSIWKKLSLPELTPTQIILELADRSTTSPSVVPWVPLILGRPFLRTARALIDVYGEELTFRVDDEAIIFKVGQTSRYSYKDAKSVNRINVIDVSCEEYAQEVLGFFNTSTSGNPTPSLDPILSTSFPSLTPFEGEGTDKLPVIISKELKDEEKAALLKVLKSHKRDIAWKISDIKGIDPRFCTHKILMEDDFKPTVQHQRRVNPKIHEVIKNEVIKLLDTRLIYPISDSPWVSPVHCVPKKGDMTVVDGFSGYFQIPIDPQDQEKTTFTCPYGTCMMAIFHDMIEETMEVFMDDFSVFGDSFSSCLSYLDKMLKRCEDTNLVLNWEKCILCKRMHLFYGHQISKVPGLRSTKLKDDVIAKPLIRLPSKAIRIF
ncbi:hypothetical protein Tco_0800417 [Tanacetum coccineum]|uniref:Reverse transcriptase domain-containing protein n=1 Tax=Tanacetum coccineum TaxID=301880 RepID=A0ABQ4ZT21_9ASTR